MDSRPIYPIIAGPTASGKSDLAIQVAKAMGGEVVSADSMQIYDTVHIGTARPLISEMQEVPHHLLGFLPLNEKYSVARYMEDASAVFADVLSRGRLPVMCGGTGLYIQSFMENRQLLEQADNAELRARLLQRAESESGQVLLEELAAIDAATASRLHPNDVHRIVRALEVYYSTGRTMAQQEELSHACPSPYVGCLIVLNFRDRDVLYRRIEQRVDRMLDSGLLEEARTVLMQSKDATVLQAIGYKELLPYLEGKISLEQAVQDLKIQTRHYAKRQLSWFRRMTAAATLYVDEYEDHAALTQAAISAYNDFVRRLRDGNNEER
ncbi:MAG: tRNA (adenosine(37)-N6)-dimethylallyltransferase MiaA [Ruminococcaceae bacterium]|nr:tRNA (adenosine(37)-N6)-dimethylallyltransferase MiaA [Oscillospiraceae bacterium]